MDHLDFDTAARLTMLQSLLEHMLADTTSRSPAGAAGLENLKDAVIGSVVDRGHFGDPVSDDVKQEFNVHFRTVTANFFSRTESLRAKLVATRGGS